MSTTAIVCEWECMPVGPTSAATLLGMMMQPPIEPFLPSFYGLLPVEQIGEVSGGNAVRAIEFSMVPSSAATATASVAEQSGSPVTGVTLTGSGHGYAAPPQVVLTGKADVPARVIALMSADDTAIVLAQGTGYTMAQVVVTGGQLAKGGTQATATATVGGGGITSVTVTSPGGPYNVPPTMTIVGDGTGAIIQAQLKVASLVLVRAGQGYTAAPAVSFVPYFKVLFPDDKTTPETQASSMAGYMTITIERHCKSKVVRLVEAF